MSPEFIAIRALIAYGYLLIVLRLGGKRLMSEATPLDFVVSLILGDLVDDLLWSEVSAAKFFVAAGSIVLADTMIRVAARHSRSFFRIVNGRGSLILRDGKEDEKQLRSEQLSEMDLQHLLRLDGIDRERWKELKLAVVETDHHLSATRHPDCEAAQKSDRGRLMEVLK